MKGKGVENRGGYYSRNLIIGERRREGEMALVDSETDAIIHLNEMGQVIWRSTEKTVSKECIIDSCGKVFTDVSYEILRRDVGKLLDQLVERKILIQVDEQSCPIKRDE